VIEVLGEPVRGETPGFRSFVGPLIAAAGPSMAASSAIAAAEAASHERVALRGESERMNDKMMPPRRAQVPDDGPEHAWLPGGPAMVRVSP
jgi:hypothetical protein